MIDVNKIRADFPILNREVYGKQLVYLDNAATSLTPQPVVDAITRMYNCHKANVHRGVHALSQEATDRMEGARAKVRDYIGAKSTAEVIFTRGTTEAINLVASSFGEQLANGDEIILTVMEHHSNIVPWQLLQRHTRVKLNVVPVDARGELDLDAYDDCFTDNTRLVAVCHASNVLGTINPIKRLVEIAHSHGVPILIDGAQAMPHRRVNVAELDCDFYAFSSHKMYGPNGVGVLYGKREWLEQMPPYQGGGEMIGTVSFERTTYAALPFKFEAGTPDFVDIAAFGTALDYINAIGIDAIAHYEQQLLDYATERLRGEVPGVRVFGEASHKCPVLSFLVRDINSYDMGVLLDRQGIAVRTGHHCAEPLMRHLRVTGTVRASFAFYNTRDDVDRFVAAVARAASMF